MSDGPRWPASEKRRTHSPYPVRSRRPPSLQLGLADRRKKCGARLAGLLHPFAENRPFARRDVIDPWRQERKGEPKRNAAKLAEKTPKTRNAETIVSASAANSHGPGR